MGTNTAHNASKGLLPGPQDPPAPPDYTGAARAQTASQMVNQYTPYGSMEYSQRGTDPQGNPLYSSNINLDPQVQQTLNTQLGLSNDLGGMAQGQIPGLQNQYSHPMDMSSVGDIANTAYGAMTSRLDPQWNQRQQQQETQLANQGLSPGTEAYTNAMRDFNNARNDAYQQANLGAIQTMPQTYQLAAQQYQQPLNIFNALRTGAQVQNPQFSPQGQGTPYMQAAQAQGQYAGDVYNAGVGANNAMTQGLFGLGGAGLIAASDRRLKTDIKRIGTRNDLPWYSFTYLWGEKSEGVMADEVLKVKPEAVIRLPSGYLAVDYGKL